MRGHGSGAIRHLQRWDEGERVVGGGIGVVDGGSGGGDESELAMAAVHD
jgi:hypothetical protein